MKNLYNMAFGIIFFKGIILCLPAFIHLLVSSFCLQVHCEFSAIILTEIPQSLWASEILL